MTFREDHDAALARADALENELELERKKTERAQDQLAAERAERKRLEGLLNETKLAQPRRLAEPQVDWDQRAKPSEPQPLDLVQAGMWAFFGFACLLFVLAVAKYG